MKKLILSTILLSSLNLQAHEVWVESEHTHGNEILTAHLGYGDFPKLEEIPESRLHIFPEPLKLIGEKETIALKKGGEKNYTFKSEKPVEAGTYLISAVYAPTFWSKNAEGWKQKKLNELENATYCEHTRMFGKNIINVGHEHTEKALISKPIGNDLEIVALDNPANAIIGQAFPLQVYFKGEPLEKAMVTATFEGFAPKDPNDKVHKLEPQAFSDTTRADGTVALFPLRNGFWKVRVEHKVDYPEQSACQYEKYYATLSFMLGDEH